jgi:hypothetical protein
MPMRLLDFSIDLILPTALGIFLGVKGGRPLRLANSSPSVSLLSGKCGNLDVPRPDTRIALSLSFRWSINYGTKLSKYFIAT